MLKQLSWNKYFVFIQSFIKDEPIDPDTEVPNEGHDDEEDIVDPMQFLANAAESYENEDAMDSYVDGDEGSPPILTSLGLTHKNHVSKNRFFKVFLL